MCNHLSKAERELFLEGKKKVSKNYERKLRHSIRRKLQRAARDIELIVASEHLTEFSNGLNDVMSSCYTHLLSISSTKKQWAGADSNRRPSRCKRDVITPRPPARQSNMQRYHLIPFINFHLAPGARRWLRGCPLVPPLQCVHRGAPPGGVSSSLS